MRRPRQSEDYDKTVKEMGNIMVFICLICFFVGLLGALVGPPDYSGSPPGLDEICIKAGWSQSGCTEADVRNLFHAAIRHSR